MSTEYPWTEKQPCKNIVMCFHQFFSWDLTLYNFYFLKSKWPWKVNIFNWFRASNNVYKYIRQSQQCKPRHSWKEIFRTAPEYCGKNGKCIGREKEYFEVINDNVSFTVINVFQKLNFYYIFQSNSACQNIRQYPINM